MTAGSTAGSTRQRPGFDVEGHTARDRSVVVRVREQEPVFRLDEVDAIAVHEPGRWIVQARSERRQGGDAVTTELCDNDRAAVGAVVSEGVASRKSANDRRSGRGWRRRF